MKVLAILELLEMGFWSLAIESFWRFSSQVRAAQEQRRHNGGLRAISPKTDISLQANPPISHAAKEMERQRSSRI